jgi:hypothetical protein
MLRVYFTNFPSQLYRVSTAQGNLATAGVGLALIQSQQFFWVGTTGVLFLPFAKGLFFPLLIGCVGLYGISFHKLQFIKYIQM